MKFYPFFTESFQLCDLYLLTSAYFFLLWIFGSQFFILVEYFPEHPL